MQLESVLTDAVLNTLSPADKLHLMRRLAVSLSEQTVHPDTWYAKLARFTPVHSVDWGTKWAADGVPDEPRPPEQLHETLTGIMTNMAQTQRALDNTMVTLSAMAERAVSCDAQDVLGVPSGVRMWRSGHGYLADKLGIDTRQAGIYRDRAELVSHSLSSLDTPSTSPLLPRVAKAYRQGRVPSQNIDSIMRSLKTMKKYLRAVGLNPMEIDEILTELDVPLVNAAVSVKPSQLSKMADDMLTQVAAIVDADGPPPSEVLNAMEDALHFRIVNGKLKIEILTDVINLELLLGIIYAGLNFRAHRNRYHNDPDTAQATVADALQTSPEEPSQSFLADIRQDLGEDATDEAIVAAAQQRLEQELRDADVHAETMDGNTPTPADMRRIDRRARPQRQHDVFMAFLRATGRLDPSIHGLQLFGGSATQLRIALDYETFVDQLGTRLPDEFHLDETHRRPDGMAGFDPGASRTLQGMTFTAEQLIDTPDDDDTTLIELKTVDGTLRIPKPRRGHPFISRGLLTGTIPPHQLRAQLCDAKIIPQLLGSGGVVLDKGRAVRTFSNQVKEDLALRGACSIPNCTAPVAYTDAHHLMWWSRNGPTNPSNAALVCFSCHTLVHQKVWTPVFDANGVLYWKPPRWLDPSQTPLRNTYWD